MSCPGEDLYVYLCKRQCVYSAMGVMSSTLKLIHDWAHKTHLSVSHTLLPFLALCRYVTPKYY